MKLTVTPTEARLLIRGYSAGRIRVGSEEYSSSIALSATELHSDFRPQHPEAIEESDLEPIFAARPEVVVIGWAGGQIFLPAARRSWFLERGVGLEVMELGAACRTYNVLVGDERKVIAILFPR